MLIHSREILVLTMHCNKLRSVIFITITYNPQNGYYTSGYGERAFFRYGLNMVTGFDYYIAKNFYFGYEFIFQIYSTKYRNIDVTMTGPNASTTPSPKYDDKDFFIGP